MIECHTWEDQRNVKCIFHVFEEIEGVDVSRIHPLQQKAVKKICSVLANDERVQVAALFGSSVNLRCHKRSDLDIVIQLKPEYINVTTKNEVSERVQEVCDWNADILWHDRIKDNKKLMENVLKGVQIK